MAPCAHAVPLSEGDDLVRAAEIISTGLRLRRAALQFIFLDDHVAFAGDGGREIGVFAQLARLDRGAEIAARLAGMGRKARRAADLRGARLDGGDRKSTRLNSSH